MAFAWVPLRPGVMTLALLMTAAFPWGVDGPLRAEPGMDGSSNPAPPEPAVVQTQDPAPPPPGVIPAVDSEAPLGPDAAETPKKIGLASYYGPALDGLPTANGERFDMQALTAAHRTLPFGTRVRVTNLRNGNQVVVRINDRGPFVRGRMVDLSYAAAERLGLVRQGAALVSLEVL